MKRNTIPLIFGILFIAAGIGYFGTAFWNWNLPLSFNQWWPLFIIVPSLAGILTNGPRSFTVAALIVGSLFLLKSLDILKGQQFQIVTTSAIVLVIGITLIVHYIRGPKQMNYRNHSGHSYSSGGAAGYTAGQENGSQAGQQAEMGQAQPASDNRNQANPYADSSNYPNYNAILSGIDVKNCASDFEGAKISAILGGANIDLRDVGITHDITIYATAVMGGIDIYAPRNVRINLSRTDIMGGTDCTAYTMPQNADVPVVTFCCNSILGGINIK